MSYPGRQFPGRRDVSPYILDPGMKPPDSPHADDDEFFEDSSGDYTEVTPSGTPTWTIGPAMARLSVTGVSGSDLVAIMKASTFSTSDHWTTRVMRISPHLVNSIGLVWSDGTATTSNILWANLLSDERLGLETGTFTALTGSYPRVDTYRADTRGVYIRLTYVSSNTFRVAYSANGYDWDTFNFSDLSYTFSPTHVGIGVGYAVGSGSRTYDFSFLRKNWTPDFAA